MWTWSIIVAASETNSRFKAAIGASGDEEEEEG